MEAVLETDHCLPAGKEPRHLNRVLHRLGTAVEEEGLLFVGAGSNAIEPFGQLHVGLVGGNREADVGEPIELLPHRLHHARMPMAGVDHADSASKVDQPVAIGVGEDRSVRMHDRYGSHRGDPPRNGLAPPGQQGTAVGTGDLGLETDDA